MRMRAETNSDFLALTAIVSVGYQFVFFAVTYVFMLDKVSDFAGASNFIVLAVLTLIYKGTWYFRQVVLSALTVIWGLRLALFLLMRILQWGEDRRLDQIHGKLGKLAIFWTFQVIWAWTVSLPVPIVNASDHNPSVRGVDIIGWVMWLLGILCEAAADHQKLSFKNSPRNKGMWCNVRLWKYSRHLNYFGEDSADKKYGNVYDYRQFKRVTSPLIPLPQVIYGNLPSWFKTFFLFEYPMYSRNLPLLEVGTNQLQDASEQKMDWLQSW